jgi:hypothetical protein
MLRHREIPLANWQALRASQKARIEHFACFHRLMALPSETAVFVLVF